MSWDQDLFPFHKLTNAEILDLSFNSSTDCLCSAQLARAKLDLLPRFDILATVSNVPHLSDLDPDLQIPSQTNFKYYSIHDFHSNYGGRNCSIKTSFSALNCNIRSLQANFDNFCCMLTDLNLMFSVIGLSETFMNYLHPILDKISKEKKYIYKYIYIKNINITKSPLSYLPPQKPNSFYLLPVTSNEIEEVISTLNTKKACGPFSIPAKLLKLLKCFLSKPLETIFNVSFTTGMVPDNFKVAKVIPIHKKGLHTSLGNYQPILLLSIFNLILEKLISKRLMKFIETQNILYTKQFGFHQNYSTTQALLSITNKIQKAVDDGTYSCDIFLDFSKAFHIVNHNILIMKLDHYGFRGIVNKWFCSYLNERKQYVSIGNAISNYKQISCGVPQGSVLGPLLFLLYINDFNNSSNQLDFHLFADDSNIFYAHKSLSELETTVNNELFLFYFFLF